MRLSQHHHNEPRSPRAWGGGKVCRDNRRGRVFHRRQSQDCGGQTISVWQSQSEAPCPWGSWGAVRRAGQRDEGGQCGVCTPKAPRREAQADTLGSAAIANVAGHGRAFTLKGWLSPSPVRTQHLAKGQPGRAGTAWVSCRIGPGFEPWLHAPGASAVLRSELPAGRSGDGVRPLWEVPRGNQLNTSAHRNIGMRPFMSSQKQNVMGMSRPRPSSL